MDNGGRSGEGQIGREAERVAAEMQDKLEGLRGYAEDAGDFIKEFARERPVAAVAIAVGLGVFLGRLMSRT
jgi:ElaB/YqjD/DUF883 family membrane-anchored ribosome-binding protein